MRPVKMVYTVVETVHYFIHQFHADSIVQTVSAETRVSVTDASRESHSVHVAIFNVGLVVDCFGGRADHVDDCGCTKGLNTAAPAPVLGQFGTPGQKIIISKI